MRLWYMHRAITRQFGHMRQKLTVVAHSTCHNRHFLPVRRAKCAPIVHVRQICMTHVPQAPIFAELAQHTQPQVPIFAGQPITSQANNRATRRRPQGSADISCCLQSTTRRRTRRCPRLASRQTPGCHVPHPMRCSCANPRRRWGCTGGIAARPSRHRNTSRHPRRSTRRR